MIKDNKKSADISAPRTIPGKNKNKLEIVAQVRSGKTNVKKKEPFILTGSKLAAFEGRKKHNEVLDALLQEIQVIDVRTYLNLPKDVSVRQKHIVVAVIKNLLEIAKSKQWNLSKVHDYTYLFNGAFWQQLDKDDMKAFLGRAAMQMGCPEYEARWTDFKKKLLEQFLTDAHLPPPPLETHKTLINLQNCTLKFTSSGWELQAFRAEDFLKYQLAFSYDPNAMCPTFDTYLLMVLPDASSRLILQEYAGYIFTSLHLEKMLVLYGDGRNGKSVFFNILQAILGSENILTYSLGSFNSEYNRARLCNALVNYSSEKGTDLNTEIFKALISGEPQQAREPYGKSFTIRNKVRFIMNTNVLPLETEHTRAYFERYLIVPFDTYIKPEERDPALAMRIINDELPGVFNWILAGLDRIARQGTFSVCEKADRALADFKNQSDNVTLFLEEYNYVNSLVNKEALTNIYNRYKIFCKEDGYKALGKNIFSKRFENKGFEKTRLNDGSVAFLIMEEPFTENIVQE